MTREVRLSRAARRTPPGAAAVPRSGTARPDIGETVRMLVEHPYVILYRLQPNVVQIVRILHGARDMDALSLDDEPPEG